ncbi:MAG: GTPase HflX [Pseudomonadota bacterium]
MKRVFGNTEGLKTLQLQQLDRLYRRRIPPALIITGDLAREMAQLSHDMRRQVGVLVNRQGRITHVIVGTHQQIYLPDTEDYRAAPDRLKGLRCIHTHLDAEPLTKDDLTDLALLRLDLMVAATVTADGAPHHFHVAHLLPAADAATPYSVLAPMRADRLDMDCLATILAIEEEMAHLGAARDAGGTGEKAVLVSVTTAPRKIAEDSLSELRELARSGGVEVVDSVLQSRKKIDPRFLLGQGKLQELTIGAMQRGANLIVFDQELNPSQIRSITDLITIKVIDRTQLILDIFAQRARSREGKLQVELAQLKYLMPRLVTKNTAMSRLTGGIGGRGPGETKLEINRRRVRDRIGRLEDQLRKVRKQRGQQKAKRQKIGLPVISIIGYTNAGKSTLLNTLTHSGVLAENRLFATLDPTSRRLRFPQDLDVIITDTVGFIRDLPKDLVSAFRATLEELESADLLLHVIDISNPRFIQQIQSVETILTSLGLNNIACLRVLNKADLLPDAHVADLVARYGGIAVAATHRASLQPLISRVVSMIEPLPEPGFTYGPAEDGFPPDND